MSIGADHCVWTGAHDFCVVGVGRGPGDAGGDAPESRGAPEGAARLGSRARQRGRATDRRPACRVPACRVPFRHDREDARARRRPYTGSSVRVGIRTVHRLASRAQRSHAGDHEHWTGLTTGYADRHQHTGAHCRPRRHEHAAQTRKPGPCASTDRTLSDLHSRLHTRCSGAGLGLAWYWHGMSHTRSA